MQKTSTRIFTSGKSSENKQSAERPVEIPHVPHSVVNAILNYSKSLTIKRSSLVGFIEVVAS